MQTRYRYITSYGAVFRLTETRYKHLIEDLKKGIEANLADYGVEIGLFDTFSNLLDEFHPGYSN